MLCRMRSIVTRSGSWCFWVWAKRAGVPAPWHPYFPGPEWATKYTEFKPDEAKQDARRAWPDEARSAGHSVDGERQTATIEISVVPAFGAWPDVAQLVAKDWEAVGVKAVVQSANARCISACATPIS